MCIAKTCEGFDSVTLLVLSNVVGHLAGYTRLLWQMTKGTWILEERQNENIFLQIQQRLQFLLMTWHPLCYAHQFVVPDTTNGQPREPFPFDDVLMNFVNQAIMIYEWCLSAVDLHVK